MVTMRQIRDYANAIAQRFRPKMIILFGSYAYGRPTEDSDVDLMVVMDQPNGNTAKAVEIRAAIPTDFPKDILVRTPGQFRERLALGDYFVREIAEQGLVLYEGDNAGVGKKSRSRFQLRAARTARPKKSKPRQRLLSRPTVRGKVSERAS